MAHDPQRVGDTRDWLVRAREDLEAARILLDAEPPHPASASFHCQQAAEKALKGFLFWHDVTFGKTHELAELGQACMELDESLNEVIRPAAQLTPFAWRFRYPGEPSEPSPEEAREALDLARGTYDAIAERIPAEARP